MQLHNIKHRAIVFDSDFNEWRYFYNLVTIISTDNPAKVSDCLSKVDNLVNTYNYHAVGFVCYDAATSDLRTGTTPSATHSSSLPLVEFAIYSYSLTCSSIYHDYMVHKNEYKIDAWRDEITEDNYHECINTIKHHLFAGNAYQVNYTFQQHSRFYGDAAGLFTSLYSQQPTQYAAFLETTNYAVCSLSPELFFKLNNKSIQTSPMKGTAKRGLTYSDDLRQSKILHNSKKDRAENVMIVDMLRNDLSNIADTGSIQTDKLFDTCAYPSLWQMTSNVSAQTHAGLNAIFRALFPCASITGAPKIAAMQIIEDLEQTSRGLYTGSIGFYIPKRRMQFNVAIRTAVIDKHNHNISYGIGSGIVIDSSAKDEYMECKLKAKFLSHSKTKKFKLVETILWRGGKYMLLDLHLQRLCASAKYFSFVYNEKRINHMLVQLQDQLVSQAKLTYKVRLLLSYTGSVEYEHTPLVGENFVSYEDVKKQQATPKLIISQQAVNSNDIFLYHKTTERDVYDKARKGYNDVILYNENSYITESTIANIVIEDEDGVLVTPRVSCGLLAGTFRQYLLNKKIITPELISINRLLSARSIYLINSVRGWRKITVRC